MPPEVTDGVERLMEGVVADPVLPVLPVEDDAELPELLPELEDEEDPDVPELVTPVESPDDAEPVPPVPFAVLLEPGCS